MMAGYAIDVFELIKTTDVVEKRQKNLIKLLLYQI